MWTITIGTRPQSVRADYRGVLVSEVVLYPKYTLGL